MWRLLPRAAPSIAIASSAPRVCLSCEDGRVAPRTPLHHKFPLLHSRSQASNPRRVGSYRSPEEGHVVRIALTGGPCAGKSSALDYIISTAKEKGYDVYIAPETATVIFNSGFQFPATDEGIYTFQESLARMQLQMERSFTNIANTSGRPSIIIFDRGLLDGKGYMDDESWQRLLSNIGGTGAGDLNGVDEEYLLGRYDAVVHLVTAADGAEKFYKWGATKDDSGHDVLRSESPEVARALDKRMQEVWAKHPNHVVVRNGAGGFKAKLDETANAVVAVALKKHPPATG